MKLSHKDWVLVKILLVTFYVTFFVVGINAVYYFLSVTSAGRVLTESNIGKNSFPKAYVVESGSMEPSIPTRGLVLTLPSKTYSIGDVITFEQKKGDVVTHRLYENLSTKEYKTKGDANEDLDVGTVSSDQVVGKVVLVIPGVGKAVNSAKTPQGFILLVIVPATIVIYEELRSLARQLQKSLQRFKQKIVKKDNWQDSRKTRAGLSKKVAIIPILGTLAILIGFTGSYFFDLETSTGNSISVATPTPTLVAAEQTLELSQIQENTPTLTPTPTPTEIPKEVENNNQEL